MKLGGHAVLFKEKISTDTLWVLKGMKDAGAEVTELGARFFGVERADELNAALKESGIELGGVHAAKKINEFVESFDECRDYLISVAEFLIKTPCRRIIMTGGVPEPKAEDNGDARLQNADFCRKAAENIDRIAKEIREKYGIQICYHNHSWEFKPTNAVYESLIMYAPNLWFALDIGWAAISGYDPEVLIRRLAGRIDYIHLRDLRNDARKLAGFEQYKDAYVALGEGDLDLRGILRALDEVAGENARAVVEYESGEEDFGRITAALDAVRPFLAE